MTGPQVDQSHLGQLRFRKMQIEDLSSVMENEISAYSHPWPKGIFADCIDSGHECWTVILSDVLIGHSILSVAAGESHLQNVCIVPSHQGRGYGRKLVEYMLSMAISRGADRIFLEVRTSNLTAYKLYESLGFNELGIRDGYYPGDSGREDGIMFGKELNL
ncbi:MAG: ribosomal-protein-alanine N-acetyltransferase [Flavobacterium sp.]|jgi:ribosomal-protein-alanine N-acetyltransferase